MNLSFEILCIIGIIICVIYFFGAKSYKAAERPVLHEAIRTIFQIIFIFAIGGLILCQVARAHGAKTEQLETMSVNEIIKSTWNTHAESKIRDLNNLQDCYIIYYRFTCPDCIGTYQDLQRYLKYKQPDTDIYYVPSDSDTGLRLLEKFPVSTVPSMIYVYPNGRTFLAEQIYMVDANHEPILDESALGRVFNTRKEIVTQ